MKHWPKFTIIVVFISFLCSCVSQSNISKQGVFSYSSKDNTINLVLNEKDKTYELTCSFKGYSLKSSCQGDWTIRNDSILLYCKDHFSSRLCSGTICEDSIVIKRKSNKILYYPKLNAKLKSSN